MPGVPTEPRSYPGQGYPVAMNYPTQPVGYYPPMAAYPKPVLDYEQARKRRLEQLEQRHSQWRPDGFSAMPADLTPFGADRIAGSVVTWARQGLQELLPAGLDLASLDQPARQALASWFVMRAMGRTSATRPRRRKASDPNVIQLSLLDQA